MQDFAQSSTFTRQLVEQTFCTTTMASRRLANRFSTDGCAGPMGGPSPNAASAFRHFPGRYEKRIFRFHQGHTHSLLKPEGADEGAVGSRGNVLLRPLMVAAPFAVIGLIWFGISQFGLRHGQWGITRLVRW
jgi:hypothetical protein